MKQTARQPRLRAWMYAVSALALLAVAALLMIPAGAPDASLPEGRAVAQDDTQRVDSGCELLQTLTYTRCTHTVTRRVTAPAELAGKTLAQVQPLYDAWEITEFSPKLIQMRQRPDLFCPDHVVLMPGEDGTLCVFQNKYGDALMLVRELDARLEHLPAALQEEVRDGLGFDDLATLEQWLESAES